MALSCTTGSPTSSAPPDRFSAQITVTNNQFSGAHETLGNPAEYSQWGLTGVTENTVQDGSGVPPSGSWNGGPDSNHDADTTYKVSARLTNLLGEALGATKNKKTAA